MSDEYRRIEVITGMARRRRWSIEEERRVEVWSRTKAGWELAAMYDDSGR